MKKKLFSTSFLAISVIGYVESANAQDVLTGDRRLACETIVCLSSGVRPSQCRSALRRYFSISARRMSNVIKKRKNFLKLCPSSSQTPEMSALVSAISRGADRCDAASLNLNLQMWAGWEDGYTYIGNQMPDYCSAYMNHEYTSFNAAQPRYVGTPEQGGYWVEAADYDQALAEYNMRYQSSGGWGR